MTLYRNRRLRREALRLKRSASRLVEPTQWWDVVASSHWFRPLQAPDEILGLLAIVQNKIPAPRAICEIGVATGGTSFLFSRLAAPDAVVILLDLAFESGRKSALAQFAREQQRIICIEADSHDPQTVQAVKSELGDRKLDLLFIDGDHSAAGVATDFKSYTPLLRPGGFVAMHDVVPDAKTRDGRDTGTYTGGVPGFWQQMAKSYSCTREIVHDPQQDGGGIGVVEWND